MEKITPGSPLSQSPDFVNDNIQILKNLFPTIVKEGKIDIEELKALLGHEIEEEEEYYRFTWAGKSNARREANKPSTATLRPDLESSKDWDTTQNIFIEGDNLEVLKLIQKSYTNKIKMIYIDPPYNTGRDFVYRDNYNDNLANYLSITGQANEEGKRYNTNSESDGRFHSNWLNMMYPRLKLSRNLLKEDGVIFISIDDNEVVNLKKICDEIFGEENFCAQVIWEQGYKALASQIAVNHEYVLIYCKNRKENIKSNNELELLFENVFWGNEKIGVDVLLETFDKWKKENSNIEYLQNKLNDFYESLSDDSPLLNQTHYKHVDENGIYFAGDISQGTGNGGRFEIFHPITKQPVAKPSGGWRFSESKLPSLLDENKIHFGKDHSTIPCLKRYLHETKYETAGSVFYKDGRGATKRLTSLLGKKYFDYPKDEIIIKRFIKWVSLNNNNDIILDFFAGSGTTAQCVYELNAEEKNSNRKFICVQLPESTDENSEAYKSGYLKISDITKERIRRASEKIKQQKVGDLFSQEFNNLDLGFRVFKLDSSNINSWDGDPENLEKTLFNSSNNIKEGRSENDVPYEILLKFGLDLTQPIDKKTIANKTVYSIGGGTLFICLGDDLSTEIAEGIGKWKNELQPIITKVIFKDNGFTDVEKTNCMQILKRFGIEEVKTI